MIVQRHRRDDSLVITCRAFSPLEKSYPCRALNLGFFLLITKTRPLRRTILQFLSRSLADLREFLTFIIIVLNAGDSNPPHNCYPIAEDNRVPAINCQYFIKMLEKVFSIEVINASSLDHLPPSNPLVFFGEIAKHLDTIYFFSLLTPNANQEHLKEESTLVHSY